MKVGINGKGFGWIDPVPYNEKIDVQGGEITLHINPYDSCELEKVDYNNNDVMETVKSNKGVLHLTNVGDTDTLFVGFKPKDGTVKCKLTINCKDGGVSYPQVEDCVVSSSPKFYIKAVEHYVIDSVILNTNKESIDITGEVKDNDGVYTIKNISGDAVVKASFRKAETFKISCECGENGTCEPYGTAEVTEGENFSCKVVANEGYEIAEVLVDDKNVTGKLVNGRYTFKNVSADHKLYATFKKVSENEAKASQYRQIVHNERI